MDNRRRKAFREALALWKEMSIIPDTYTIKKPTDFKQNILNRLGIAYRENGCPFCHIYIGEDDCPLGDCENNGTPCFTTVYDKWDLAIYDDGMHCQKYAIEFYKYLEDLARAEGYYDNEDKEEHRCD